MKLLNTAFLVGLVASQNTMEFHRNSNDLLTENLSARWPDLKRAWAEFKFEFKKVYSTLREDERRMKIWLENLLHIENHNAKYESGDISYNLKMNIFGDMSNEEFRKERNGYNYEARKNNSRLDSTLRQPIYMLDLDFDEDSLPDNVDWRDQGYVTDVKDQGQCGSCWSFSTTGALEGQMKRKTGKLVSLSEQNLIDCSRREGNMGCNGGLMDNAFQYIKEQHGIDSEESYPYEMRDDQPCRFKKGDIAGEDVGFVDIPQFSEKHLKDALATQGPVSVAIDAGHRSFQFYSSGIYYEPACSPTQLDHGVLAVGYGVDSNVEGKNNKYWLIKNSWSSKWGDSGYIKIARNRHNHCGVATAASYPLV
jgi:cathepsin L